MPVIICPLKSCTYETPDVDASIAAYLLIIHSNVHIYASLSKPKPLMGTVLKKRETVMKRYGTPFCKNGQCLKIAQR